MIPPPLLTKLEEDKEKDMKKWDGWMGGWMGGWMDGLSLNRVISRAPVELITKQGNLNEVIPIGKQVKGQKCGSGYRKHLTLTLIMLVLEGYKIDDDCSL